MIVGYKFSIRLFRPTLFQNVQRERKSSSLILPYISRKLGFLQGDNVPCRDFASLAQSFKWPEKRVETSMFPCQPDYERSLAVIKHKRLVENLSATRGTLVVYSDGSLTASGKGGCGVTVYENGQLEDSREWALCMNSSNFEIEAVIGAINLASDIANTMTNISAVYLFSDNVSAIQIFEDPPKHFEERLMSRARKAVTDFFEKNPSTSLSIAWCPGHASITGNQMADSLAKKASSYPIKD